jgi:hypothetical protein
MAIKTSRLILCFGLYSGYYLSDLTDLQTTGFHLLCNTTPVPILLLDHLFAISELLVAELIHIYLVGDDGLEPPTTRL